jgi:three-Cys-motif partner protein
MPAKQIQMFGGDWTEQKLDMLRQYLTAYATALKKQPFELIYIDAFAGTGYREPQGADARNALLFPDLAGQEPQQFLAGSAALALQVEPPFHKYVFVENAARRFGELAKLKEQAGDRRDRIDLVQEDCNTYLRRVCKEWDWRGHRAVLFLDPYGMQVEWSTIEAIASTEAVDVWILFPLGVAVNRLLKRNGDIPETWRARLDSIFGTQDWYSDFYTEAVSQEFFGPVTTRQKSCSLAAIAEYYNQRLRSVFAAVAENPKQLCNSQGNPLFLLCFAAANKRGAPIALKIAEHILKG